MSSKLVSVPTVISLAQFYRQKASHFVKEIAAVMQNSQLKTETVSRRVPEAENNPSWYNSLLLKICLQLWTALVYSNN